MRFTDILASAVASLRRRPLRTVLTSTGVVIGTMAVVVMISLGVGLARQTEVSANSPTVRQVSVQNPPPGERGKPAPKMDDALAQTLATFEGVEAVFPEYFLDMKAKAAGIDQYFSIRGIPAEAFSALGYDLAWGNMPERGGSLQLLAGGKTNESWDPITGEPTSIDFKDRALFLTADTASGALMEGAAPAPVIGGASGAGGLEVSGTNGSGGTGGSGEGTTSVAPPRPILARVSGQIAEDPQVWTATSAVFFADIDTLVSSLKKSLPNEKLPGQQSANAKPGRNFIYNEFIVMAKDADAALNLTTELRDSGYGAFSEAEWILEAKKTAARIQAALGGIGAISMLVAAIGIANTMLMSVYERQRDIGVMKVIGASMRDIRWLFLVESSSIGFLGGVVGIVLSYGLSALINSLTFQPDQVGGISQIPPVLAVAAVAGATLIAMASGMVPARRAMRLSPLAAMTAQR